MADADYRLLQGNPRSGKVLDYYFSGVRFLNTFIRDYDAPRWLKKTISHIDASYTNTDPRIVTKHLNKTLDYFEKGDILQEPSFLTSWDELKSLWNGSDESKIYIPASHLFKTLYDHRNNLEIWPNYFKLTFGMIFGDIGATLFKARKSNTHATFSNEFEDVFVKNPSVKTVFDLHYMFGTSSHLLLMGYDPKLLGSASGEGKAPDIQFKTGQFSYYLEATRKNPAANKPERELTAEAIKSKVVKVAPNLNSNYDPCIISTDISNSEFFIEHESLNTNFITKNSPTGVIYKAYNDPIFCTRLQKFDNALSVAAVLTAYYRKNHYGIAGTFVSRNQLLQIDHSGIAQADGSFLVLHKDFENNIPQYLAKNIYIVDDSCIPGGFTP